MTHDYSDLSLSQVQGVPKKRVNLVKMAVIKIISIFFGHPVCALQSGEKNHHNHHQLMLLMMMLMMETTLRRTQSEKGRVTILYRTVLYCTVLYLEEDAE